MTTRGECSSAPPNLSGEKPVIVRVKRKSHQSRLDAFWLEINERPSKRTLLDFEKLSISDDSLVLPKVEESKTKKVFVWHFETVSSSEATIEIVQSFVPKSTDVTEDKLKHEERRHTIKKDNKQRQLLSKARQNQEVLAKNARFEQIWRSRRGKKEPLHDKALHDMFHFYDVVRVDVDEKSNEVQDQEAISLEDQRILSSYLPLLREFIPSAAEEIECDIHEYISQQGALSTDDYVYDYYSMNNDMDICAEDACPFPLVQVEDEDFYDGPDDESESDSEDSNSEAHPQNDYPDETSEEEEEEEASEACSNESEEQQSDSTGSKSSEFEDLRYGLSEDADQVYEDDIYDDFFDDGDSFDYNNDNFDDGGDGEDWR